MTTRKPSAVRGDAGLRRGVGAAPAEPVTEAEAAAFIEGSTPAQKRVRETLQPPRPPKPVRFTLDLDQERHAFLKRFALESGAGTGGSVVMRALLDELRDSPTLSMKVRARLRQPRG